MSDESNQSAPKSEPIGDLDPKEPTSTGADQVKGGTSNIQKKMNDTVAGQQQKIG